jgi:uracil-DNA glycosylase family 4
VNRPPEIVPKWDCTDCSLRETARRPVWGRGPKDPLFMIVGEGPGPVEDLSGIPFDPTAPAGRLITDILKELGVSRSEIYITNATRCCKGFPIGQEISPKHIKACKPHLLDEIAKVNPKYIIPAGNEALKACLGHAGVTKAHGLLTHGPDGRMYMPIIHPAAALPSRYPEYREKIKSALRDIIGKIKNEARSPLHDIKCNVITNIEDFQTLQHRMYRLQQHDEKTVVCFDLETNSLDNAFKNPNCRVGGIALAWDENEGWYLPVDHENPVVWTPEQRAHVVKFVIWFAKSKFRKVNQYIKFDINMFRGAFHVRPRNIAGDCMLGSHLVDQNTTHGLDKIAWKVKLGGYDQPLEDWFMANKIPEKQRVYTQVPLDVLGPYGCGDAVCALRAEFYFRKILEKRHQLRLYQNHVVPGILPYADMEVRGMLADAAYLDSLTEYYERKTLERKDNLKRLAGAKRLNEILLEKPVKGKKVLADFNFDSPEQVGRMLERWIDAILVLTRIKRRKEREMMGGKRRNYADLKAAELNPLRTITITKNGRLSVGKGTLDSILANTTDFKLSEDQRNFLTEYLLYKGGKKRLSTSVVGLRKFICPDGRVRSTYLLHGAATGRRSSAGPNLQNIPRDRLIKRIFIAQVGYILLMFDYKNLEVRIAASMSGDEKLLAAFNGGKDVHCYTASVVYRQSYKDMMKVLDTPYDVVKNDEKLNERYLKYSTFRAQAKLVMWTILFGGGAEKISTLTGVTMGEAERTLNAMLNEFDGLRAMFERFEDFAEDHGYAKTDFGRRRYLLGISSSDERVRRDAIREALNTPIQGTAAGITYEAMRRVWRSLRKEKVRGWPVQEVHDSIVVEVDIKDAYKAASISLEAMTSVVTRSSKGNIVFEADAAIGRHLGAKTKIDQALLEQLRTDPQAVYDMLTQDMSCNPVDYEARKEVIEEEEDAEL